MICLIICIVSAFLCWCGVFSEAGLVIALTASVILEFLFAHLYFKFGFLKFYYHDLLGWHTPDDSPHYHDGLSEHATCKHCGKDIMQDSQGNWF